MSAKKQQREIDGHESYPRENQNPHPENRRVRHPAAAKEPPQSRAQHAAHFGRGKPRPYNGNGTQDGEPARRRRYEMAGPAMTAAEEQWRGTSGEGRARKKHRRLVDTNLIVRYLVQDHEKHAKAAGKLFEACDRGEVEIVVLSAVLAECVFVLESFYRHARTDIAAALGTLISSPGVEIGENAIHLDALERYRKTKVHFVDCLLAATAKAEDTPVATFDEDFRKFADVRVEIE